MAAIEAAITRAMTSTDPAICDELFTDRWLESNFVSSTQDPVDRCREATTEDPTRKAGSVSVSGVSVDGGHAVATAEASGGNVGAATLELALIEADGGWRLDELTNIGIDRARYLTAQRDAVDAMPLPSDAEPLLRCMVDYVEAEVSGAEIEKALLAGSESFYAGAYESCRQEFRLYFLSPASIAATADYSRAKSRCISGAASTAFSDSELQRYYTAFATEEPPPRSLSAKTDAVIAACTG